MNKKLASFSLLTLFLFSPLFSSAVVFGEQPPSLIYTVPSLLNTILNVVWWIFMAIAIILFIMAGIAFLTAQGDAEELRTARLFVIWGAVGVGVAILAFSIINIVGTLL